MTRDEAIKHMRALMDAQHLITIALQKAHVKRFYDAQVFMTTSKKTVDLVKEELDRLDGELTGSISILRMFYYDILEQHAAATLQISAYEKTKKVLSTVS